MTLCTKICIFICMPDNHKHIWWLAGASTALLFMAVHGAH